MFKCINFKQNKYSLTHIQKNRSTLKILEWVKKVSTSLPEAFKV